MALTAIVRRLPRLRLLDDPPPYRPGASLRGPRRLRLAVEAPVGAAR